MNIKIVVLGFFLLVCSVKAIAQGKFIGTWSENGSENYPLIISKEGSVFIVEKRWMTNTEKGAAIYENGHLNWNGDNLIITDDGKKIYWHNREFHKIDLDNLKKFVGNWKRMPNPAGSIFEENYLCIELLSTGEFKISLWADFAHTKHPQYGDAFVKLNYDYNTGIISGIRNWEVDDIHNDPFELKKEGNLIVLQSGTSSEKFERLNGSNKTPTLSSRGVSKNLSGTKKVRVDTAYFSPQPPPPPQAPPTTPK